MKTEIRNRACWSGEKLLLFPYQYLNLFCVFTYSGLMRGGSKFGVHFFEFSINRHIFGRSRKKTWNDRKCNKESSVVLLSVYMYAFQFLFVSFKFWVPWKIEYTYTTGVVQILKKKKKKLSFAGLLICWTYSFLCKEAIWWRQFSLCMRLVSCPAQDMHIFSIAFIVLY